MSVAGDGQPFLVRTVARLPTSLSQEERQSLLDAEHAHARELLAAGFIQTIWRIPGRRENIGIWHAASADELHERLSALPMFDWLDITVTALATHPVMPDAP